MSREHLPDQVMFKLISEVKCRPFLWNPYHADYKVKYNARQAWMAISEEMNVPQRILRIKWKNLRDMYRKLSKKSPKNGLHWKYYRRLQFLVFKNDNESENGELETCEVEEDTASDPDTTETFVNFEPEAEDTAVYLDVDPFSDNRKKRSEDEEDYDIMFLKSLAPYFKQLEPIRKLVVRSRMQELLLNELVAQTSKSNAKS